MTRLNRILVAAGLSLACLAPLGAQAQVSPSFTYQGKLEMNNTPVTGVYQFYFIMYDSPNGFNVVGNYGNHDAPISIAVDKGLFTAELQFPASVLNGAERYLSIAVRRDASSPWTALEPRQRLAATPYATFASTIPGTSTNDADVAGFGIPSYFGFKMSVRTTQSNALALVSPSNFGCVSAVASEAAGGKNFSLVSTGPGYPGGAGQFVIRDVNAATDRITVASNGHVGINTAPGAFTFAVNGTAAKPGGGSWSVFSDSRLKQDIKPLAGTLDRLLKLRGYSYQYKDEAIEKQLALPGEQLGLIAEEVQQVFPDWVDTDASGYRHVTERATTALMVEALRDLRAEKDKQIGAIKLRNDTLHAENEALRARLDRLEAAIKAR